MLYQHKKTGEKREFVQGMKIADEWSPVHVINDGVGVLSISQVDPKSIDTIKTRRAKATKARNKALKKEESK